MLLIVCNLDHKSLFLDGFDDGAIGNVMSHCQSYVFEEDIFDNVFCNCMW